jgi:hypothetical protein
VGETSLLVSGGTLTIDTTTQIATFSANHGNNVVGVGDVIQYDSTDGGTDYDGLAFISSRIDMNNFRVRNAAGAAPAAASGTTVYRIHRAYTSLANAASGTENTSIFNGVTCDTTCATLRNFDTGARNAVTNQEGWTFNLYPLFGGAGDTASADFSTWTTSSYYNIVLQADQYNRHEAVWATDVYYMDTVGTALAFGANSVTIDGLQARTDLNNLTNMISTSNSSGTFILRNSIIRGFGLAGGEQASMIYFYNSGSTFKAYISNNIVVNQTAAGALSAVINDLGVVGAVLYGNNNTVAYAAWHAFGFYSGDNTVFYLKNNLSVGTSLANKCHASCDYNVATITGSLYGANDRQNEPVVFVNAAGGDYRLADSDTYAKDRGMNLSADSNLPVTTDIRGSGRGGVAWDIGAYESATSIFRSVGPGNTACLAAGGAANATACGLPNLGSMNLWNGNLQLGSAMPTNVGVGDAVVYDCSADGNLTAADCVGYIHKRYSSTSFDLRTVDGRVPANTNTGFRIFRAYNSIANAMQGRTPGMNSSIVALVGIDNDDLDQWTGVRELFTYNEQWNVALYADGADPGDALSPYNWDASSNAINYTRIFAPSLTSEVGVTQRHAGVWDNTKARVSTTGSNTIYARSTVVDGLQIETTGSTNGLFALALYNCIRCEIKNNIIRNSGAGTNRAGIYTDGVWNARVFNNVIYDFSTAGSDGVDLFGFTQGAIYNNTIFNNSAGIVYRGGYGAAFKNNLLVANTVDFQNTIGPNEPVACRNNATTDGTSTTACAAGISSGNLTGVATTVFVDSTNRDLRLKTATAPVGQGLNFSTTDPDGILTFTTDIIGTTRTNPWDIGACRGTY